MKLSEADWHKVFEARCRAKRGIPSQDDLELCIRAWKADKKRYAEMASRVFIETAPFGSNRGE